MPNIVVPRILVLEGLYADTTDIIDAAGGIGIEGNPWDFKDTERRLKSGLIDGLLLTGGSDVNPARYGEAACPVTQSPDNTRDAVELFALKHAREAKIPVLGICRGSQIMCVSQGGRLTQDIQLYTEAWEQHGHGQHGVCPTNDSRILSRMCSYVEPMHVISLHHQCVADPGLGMRIAAKAYDGTPEAIESKDGLMLGVQFHPEMSAFSDEQCFDIFRWLVQTAAHRKGGKAQAVSFRDEADAHYAAISFAYTAWKADRDAKEDNDPFVWDDDKEVRTTSSKEIVPVSTQKQEGRHRQAGDAAIPSMRATTPREMVTLIESSTGSSVVVTDAHGNVIDSTCEEEPTIQVPFACDTPRSDHLLEQSLMICPACAMRFECIEDCDDHKKYVHPNPEDYARPWAERFAEMQEPPAGSPDWAAVDDALILRLAQDNGYEVIPDWEDMG